jgi:DNA primase
VHLPDGHDPDSYIKALGPEEYRQRLEEAPPYMEWLVRRALARNDIATPTGKGAYFAALLPHLARIESPVERSAWLRVVAQRGSLDPSAAAEELRRALRGAPSPRKEPVPAKPTADVRRVLPAERYLLALLLEGADGAAEAAGELDEEDVRRLGTADAFRAARRLVAQGDRVTMASLEGEVADEELKRVLREIAMAGGPEDGISAVDCVRELKRRPLEARMDEIQESLRTASGDSALALLTEKLEIGRTLAGL